jgi:hypothetical protein
MEDVMLTSKIESFSELFSIGWYSWKHMFQTLPYWDPYGATLTLAMAVALLGYTIKNVMD